MTHTILYIFETNFNQNNLKMSKNKIQNILFVPLCVKFEYANIAILLLVTDGLITVY